MTQKEAIPQTGGTHVRMPDGSLILVPEGGDPLVEIDKETARRAAAEAAAVPDSIADQE